MRGEVALAEHVVGGGRDRNERRHLLHPHAREAARRHADDGVLASADVDGLAEHVARSAVARLPEAVAENRHGLPAGRRVLRRTERPAENRRRVEDLPEARAHEAGAQLPRVLAAAHHHLGIEDHGALAEVAHCLTKLEIALVGGVGAEVVGAFGGARDDVDAVRAAGIGEVGGWAKQQPVDDAEHRGIGADGERERGDDGRGEAGRPAHLPDGVGDVLAKCVEAVVADHAGLPALGARAEAVASVLEVAEAAQGLLARRVGGPAVGHEPFGAHLEMRADFIVEIAQGALATVERKVELPANAHRARQAPRAAARRISVTAPA